MIFSSLPLLAYIDPGTGAVLIQAAIAIFLTAGVVFRRVVLSPFAWMFGRGVKSESDTPNTEDSSPDASSESVS